MLYISFSSKIQLNLVPSFDNILTSARDKLHVDKLDRSKNSNLCNRVPLVLELHPALMEINGIVETLWPILETSEKMRDVLGSRPIIVSYRTPKNLKDSLVRSKVKRDRNVSIGMSKKC